MKEDVTKRVSTVNMLLKEGGQINNVAAKKREDREKQEENCLKCVIAGMEVRNFKIESVCKNNLSLDEVLDSICAEKRDPNSKEGGCNNRACFEDPDFKIPKLSYIRTVYAIKTGNF